MTDKSSPRLSVVALGILISGIICVTGQASAATDVTARVDMAAPHPQPPYPDSAQVNGEEGTVQLDVYVRPNGHAAKVRISQSSGFNDLDLAAVQGVLNWHYIPAERGGDLVPDWTTVKVEFQLPRMPAQPAN